MKAVNEAKRFVRGAVQEQMELCHQTGGWILQAYKLGVAGNIEEAQGGLGRSIYEQEHFDQFRSSEWSQNGWFGWSGTSGGLNPRNSALDRLGIF